MKKLLVSFLTLALTGPAVLLPEPSLAQSVYRTATLDSPTLLDEVLSVPGGERTVSLSVEHENLRGVLRNLAMQAGMNLIMDESVSGTVTIDLNNVSINQALQAVASLANVMIVKQTGGIYLAISRKTAEEKGLRRQLSKVIKIYYSNAHRVADILNRSLFADANMDMMNASMSGGAGGGMMGGAGNMPKKASADPRTNSVIVVGTSREIQLAEAAVAKLDVPRQSKTFYLSHANALDVATMLSSSIFNDGTAALSTQSGGGSASGGSAVNGQAQASSLRVERQDVQEGSGINSFGGGGGGSGLTSGLSSSVTLRGFAKTTDTVQVSPEGPMVIPDSRQNAVTVMGTAEQIALAERLIPTLDAQLPQVSIEASLIEISHEGVRELGTQFGLSDGRMQTGFNNQALEGVRPVPGLPANLQPPGTGLIGLPTNNLGDVGGLARSGIMLSSRPLAKNADFSAQVRSLITQRKARILANPTVVATHDTESIISIVDEVVRRVTTQSDPNGAVTQNVEIGEVGIVMDILPKIGEDGTVSLRLRPSVTSLLQEGRDAFGNLYTLLSKRDLLAQNVRVRNGETLVIGGLVQQSDTMQHQKLPIAGDLPIVGAMFRASSKNNKRTELVLMITPHILNTTKLTPVHTSTVNPPAHNSILLGGNH